MGAAIGSELETRAMATGSRERLIRIVLSVPARYAAEVVEMDDPGPEFTPGDGKTYAEERRTRLHKGRVLGFAVCIALWLLSAVPLIRLSSDEGGGAGVAAVYLAAGLGLAVVTRGIYARLRGLRFWSPWLFVTAAVLAIASYAVVSAGEQAASPRVEHADGSDPSTDE